MMGLFCEGGVVGLKDALKVRLGDSVWHHKLVVSEVEVDQGHKVVEGVGLHVLDPRGA